MNHMPRLRIGKFEARVPIIQGGMGVQISLSGLASAVAKEGGIGVIASVGIGQRDNEVITDYVSAHKQAIIDELRKAREKTDGIIGVNIMVALTDFDQHIEGAVEGGADIVFMGAGLPRKLPESIGDINKLHTEFVPIVSSVRAISIIFKYWARKYNYTPPAVVVEGPLAGGHLGFKREQIDQPDYQLENLIPQVIEAIEPFKQSSGRDIAIIAAGGIFSGADIYKFLQSGVQGVQMATRFVATHECDAHIKFKEAHVNCTKDDLIIINSPVCIPGRAIRSPFLDEVEAGNEVPYECPYKCLITCDVVNAPYCIALALLQAKRGNIDEGYAFAGANAWRTKEIVSVKELIDSLQREYSEAVDAAGQ
ncbi:MAG: nitronate monooxygenase [Candidatus Krumholzibacteriota bacterium]|nr:nitronate monooxygenase [Candidatus Krumholzibacteriota bacterium]